MLNNSPYAEEYQAEDYEDEYQLYADLDTQRNILMQRYIFKFSQPDIDPQDVLEACKSDVFRYLEDKQQRVRKYVAYDTMANFDEKLRQKKKKIEDVFNSTAGSLR